MVKFYIIGVGSLINTIEKKENWIIALEEKVKDEIKLKQIEVIDDFIPYVEGIYIETLNVEFDGSVSRLYKEEDRDNKKLVLEILNKKLLLIVHSFEEEGEFLLDGVTLGKFYPTAKEFFYAGNTESEIINKKFIQKLIEIAFRGLVE